MPSEDTPSGILIPTHIPASDAALHRDAARLLARLKAMREMQESSPGEVPGGLTAEDLAQRLTWDMVGTLVRTGVVLDAAIPAIIALIEVEQERNDLARADQALRLRELTRQEKLEQEERTQEEDVKRREDWAWSILGRCMTWAEGILGQSEVKTAIASALAAIIGTLTILISGYLIMYGDGSLPQSAN